MEEDNTGAEWDPANPELMIPHAESTHTKNVGNAALIPKCITDKKYPLAAAVIITPLVLAVIVLAGTETMEAGKKVKKYQPCSPCPPPVHAACPDRWIGYQGKCYYTSNTQSNWTASETICSSFDASLAIIDTLWDLGFLVNYTRPHHYWIGLWRVVGQAWRWPNGTEFNNLFHVQGEGECAYLDDNGVSSTRCFREKNLLCSQPDGCTRQKKPNVHKSNAASP